MSSRSPFYRHYMRLHYDLREWCDRLSPKARKRLVYGIGIVYLVCSLVMIAQLFSPRSEKRLPIPKSPFIDAPIGTSSVNGSSHATTTISIIK